MKSVTLFFRLTVPVIYFNILFTTAQLVNTFFTTLTLRKELSGNGDGDSLEILDYFESIESSVESFVTISFGLCFLIWFYLSYREAQRIAGYTFSYRSIVALFSFFIPVFNLFAPYRIMREIWQVHDCDDSRKKFGYRLINKWWFLSLFIFFFGRYCKYRFKEVADLNELLTSQYYYLAYYVGIIFQLIIMARLLHLINREQRNQQEFQLKNGLIDEATF